MLERLDGIQKNIVIVNEWKNVTFFTVLCESIQQQLNKCPHCQFGTRCVQDLFLAWKHQEVHYNFRFALLIICVYL